MRIGILLIFVGVVVLGGYGAYVVTRAIVLAPEVPLAIRFGIPTLGIGVLVTLIKALWDRLRIAPGSDHDYREAQP